MDSFEHSKNITTWTGSTHTKLRAKREWTREKISLQIHLYCFISCVCICAHTYSVQRCGSLTTSFTVLHQHMNKDFKQYGHLYRNYNCLMVMCIVQ